MIHTKWRITQQKAEMNWETREWDATHWARIRKKVQKPPQSTHLISRSEWPPHSTQYVFKWSIFLPPPHSTCSCQKLWLIEWNVEGFFPKKGVYQIRVKLTLDEFWCFPQKEFIPFLGDHYSFHWFLPIFEFFWKIY